jgi:hypothetical protein
VSDWISLWDETPSDEDEGCLFIVFDGEPIICKWSQGSFWGYYHEDGDYTYGVRPTHWAFLQEPPHAD